ncbi:MAG: ABC transporter ATP-binding protein, partial [Cyclobacteriaceae bacterium]
MMNDSPLFTKNISIGYPSVQDHILFSNLNLSLYNGQLVCFMGPNGIGKSTLIRTLSGSQKPLSGEIHGIGNKNVAVVLTERVNAGMMTARELVSYGRYPYLGWSVKLTEEDQIKIDEAVQQVRINDLLDKPIYELSDGQMQMVMIARALAQDTPVLLLDEPTAHLDLNNRVEIMNLLRKLAKENNKAILVSTHELDLALQTADLVWLATSQKSIRVGMPEDLVLDGTFDEVFQFKGFDLKTGRVKQEPYRNTGIYLIGEGHAYLWTKNALERNGFHIDPNSSLSLKIETLPNGLSLSTNLNNEKHTYPSIAELLKALT